MVTGFICAHVHLMCRPFNIFFVFKQIDFFSFVQPLARLDIVCLRCHYDNLRIHLFMPLFILYYAACLGTTSTIKCSLLQTVLFLLSEAL